MDLSSRKYKLIEKLLKVEEETILYQLESIMDKEGSKDFWSSLPSEVQQLIDKGIEQSQNGQSRAHEEVMAEIKKKYSVR